MSTEKVNSSLKNQNLFTDTNEKQKNRKKY